MVNLRQIQESHFPQITKWAQCEELAEYFRRFPPQFTWSTWQTAQQYFANAYLICEDDAPIGLVQLATWDAQNRKAELGIMIDKELCKNRAKAAFESSYQLAEYAFDYLGYNKLFCLVLSHRKDISRLLCTFNFKQEGMLRENVYWQGKFHDELVFGLTKDDFRRIK